MIRCRRIVAKVLTLVMIVSFVFPFVTEQSAQGKSKRPKLSVSSITVTANKTKMISVKNAKNAKFTWKSKNKKYATVKAAGKGKAKIKGVRKGNTKITCKVKVNKKTYNLTCKVKVNDVSKAPTAKPTNKPTAIVQPTATSIVSPTASPSVTPEVTPTPIITPLLKPLYSPKPEDDPNTLKGAYTSFFENVGTCLNSNQLNNPDTLTFVKNHYNSFTLENQMKPSYILGNSIKKISKDEAVEKGYVIPANYTETNVPQLNFDTIDQVLKIAYDNNLKIRAHTLVWHSQSTVWFFREGFTNSTSAKFATKDVMDARMEFYIRTVMKHIYDSQYGSVVYAWDVVNEYFHADKSNWIAIYGDINTKPEFVKKAFTIAHDVLKEYGLENSVGLFYNDYNTYEVKDKIVSMINFVNSDEKVCDGIGMQSHLDTSYPTIDVFEQAIDKFINANFEVQITELDVTINYHGEKGHTDEMQATYMGDLMKMLINKRAAGANISGVTWWGLYDDVSWRRGNANGYFHPLLFCKGITDPKPSFTAVINAAADYWRNK